MLKTNFNKICFLNIFSFFRQWFWTTKMKITVAQKIQILRLFFFKKKRCFSSILKNCRNKHIVPDFLTKTHLLVESRFLDIICYLPKFWIKSVHFCHLMSTNYDEKKTCDRWLFWNFFWYKFKKFSWLKTNYKQNYGKSKTVGCYLILM